MTIGGRREGQAPPRMPSRATTVGAAFAALQSVAEAQREYNAELATNAEYYTRDGFKAKQLEFKDSETAKLVDAAEFVVGARKDVARNKFHGMIGGMVDTSADSAQEQRNDRYLDGVRRRVGADDEPGSKIARARAELGDPQLSRNQRGLLAEEFRTLFPDDNGWVQAELTKVDPELGAAHQELHNCEQSSVLISAAAKQLRAGLGTGAPPSEDYLRTLAPAVARYDPDTETAESVGLHE
jgi:hypothetical protein